MLSLGALAGCADRTLPTALESAPPRLVYNGAEVDVEEFSKTWSFAAAVLTKNEAGEYGQICTASVVAARWVLTAAHCAVGRVPAELTISVGSPDLLGTGARKVEVEEIHVHDRYSESSNDFDVALLKLKVDAGVAPAAFPDEDVFNGDLVRVGGFGRTESGTASPVLRFATLTVTDYWFGITNFIAEGTDAGACVGDSGGPALNSLGQLVGVTSFGAGNCGPPFYSGYVSVIAVEGWMKQIAGYATFDQTAPSIETGFYPGDIVEGGEVSFGVFVSDERRGWSPIASIGYSLDGGITWTAMAASDGAFDGIEERASATITAPAAGQNVLTIRATDFAGQTATATREFTVRSTLQFESVTLAPEIVPVGADVQLSVSAGHVAPGSTVLSGIEYSVSGGPWVPMAAEDGTYDEGREQAVAIFKAPAAGLHNVAVRAQNAVGRTLTATVSLSVYDPAGGFVVANGKYWSPPGADTFNPEFAEEAEIRFMAAYKKGATTPTGQTQLRFKSGALGLESTSYEYLLVSGQDKVQFWGSGTLSFASGNETGAFAVKFRIWANSTDQTVRVRIWSGNDHTEYDTKTYLPLTSGRIVIQSPGGK